MSASIQKNILAGQLNDDIKQIFQSIADDSDFEIEVMETDQDHIHFLIRYIPRLSIAQIVRRLKQESTRQIGLLHIQHHFVKSTGTKICFGQMVISFVQ